MATTLTYKASRDTPALMCDSSTTSALTDASCLVQNDDSSTITSTTCTTPSRVLLSPIRSSTKHSPVTPLTIDKLAYKHLGLIGREEELQVLQGVLEKEERKQLVWIYGESGTGKTALVRQAVKKSTRCEALVGMGKFDEPSENARNDVPFSAIGMACGEICSQILSLTSSSCPMERQHFQEIQRKMEGTLGAGSLGTLIKIIPALAEVIDTKTPTAASASETVQQQESSSDAESAKNRLNFAFKSWLKVVTQFFSPLVLILDDLQWADLSSLSLLESLMTDRNAPALILMGIYRHNEVSDTNPLARMQRTLAAQTAGLDIVHLEVHNLALPAVHSIVHTLLHPLDDKPAQTLELAKLCLSKTNGNVFFLLQYMSMLHRSNLLKFNIGRLQ